MLWAKNEVYGMNFNYVGDNSFEYPGLTKGANWTLHFEIMSSGAVKLTQTSIDEKGVKESSVSIKEK